jgi:hypothetical protein
MCSAQKKNPRESKLQGCIFSAPIPKGMCPEASVHSASATATCSRLLPRIPLSKPGGQVTKFQCQALERNIFFFISNQNMIKSPNLLSDAERDISILNHVRDLALHCEDKQDNPIAEQYGPENRDVK